MMIKDKHATWNIRHYNLENNGRRSTIHANWEEAQEPEQYTFIRTLLKLSKTHANFKS